VELADITTRIGQGNFVDFVGIQPNLALAAFKDIRRKTLLKFQRNCEKATKG
jgi:hypothetical protein